MTHQESTALMILNFLDLKYLFFSVIFLSEIGEYPPPTLNGNNFTQKPLAELGVTPLPLTEKDLLCSILTTSLSSVYKQFITQCYLHL